MRIGVVCDTHNHIANVRRIVQLFENAGVERVIHTGDVTQPKTLAALAGLSVPLVGVYGNNDVPERPALDAAAADHGFDFRDPPWSFSWGDRRIVVAHDPRELEAVDPARHDVLLHGHTHRLRVERRHGRLVFNPGECAGHVPGLNAVGMVDLSTMDVTLLHF